MKKLIALVASLIGLSSAASYASQELDYSQMVHLDAEELAETGIKKAYDAMNEQLRKYVPSPMPISEEIDSDKPFYAVVAGATRYVVFSPQISEEQSWGNGGFVLFDIINRQLKYSKYKFYAFYNGNDLSGMFLTEAQVEAAKKSLQKKYEWPYIPTQESPWFGQFH